MRNINFIFAVVINIEFQICVMGERLLDEKGIFVWIFNERRRRDLCEKSFNLWKNNKAKRAREKKTAKLNCAVAHIVWQPWRWLTDETQTSVESSGASWWFWMLNFASCLSSSFGGDEHVICILIFNLFHSLAWHHCRRVELSRSSHHRTKPWMCLTCQSE